MLFPKLSRNALVPLASGTLILALSFCAAAQGAPQQVAQSAPKTPGQASPAQSNAQPLNSVMPDQPPTLAELARLARAKKKSEPVRAVKVFDDDNLSHTPRDAAEMALDASFNSAPSEEGSSPSSSSGSSGSRGKVTLLDFWATWCGPCRASIPDLKQLQSVYGSDKLEVVSISEDHSQQAWQQFVAANGMNWTQRFDEGGAEMHHYGANALPTYIVLDSNGSVLGRLVGEDPSTPLSQRLAPLLNR